MLKLYLSRFKLSTWIFFCRMALIFLAIIPAFDCKCTQLFIIIQNSLILATFLSYLQIRISHAFTCNIYRWMLQLLLLVGAKLEHIITKLAQQMNERASHQQPRMKLSNEHFWFNRPALVLYLIHFILFQNAFELAVFFWIWVRKLTKINILQWNI